MKYRLTPLGRIVIIAFCLTLVSIILIIAINFSNKPSNNYSTDSGDTAYFHQSQENYNSLHTNENNDDISEDSKAVNNDVENSQPTIVEVTNSKELINNTKLSIYFGANVSILEESYCQALDIFVAVALSLDGLPIQVEGNCSTVSSDDADLNYELSLSRAKAVSNYLQSKGIDPNRILVIGNGSSYPINDNSTSDNRKFNRRVDIFFRGIEY